MGDYIERYSVVLRHEMIIGNDVIQLDKPLAVEFCTPKDPRFNGSVIISDMMDRLKDGLLKQFEEGE